MSLRNFICSQSCVCTELDVAGYTLGGNTSVNNACRFEKVTGRWINVTGYLVNQRSPGLWEESMKKNAAPSVNYTVIALGSQGGEEYAVEFDCGESFGIVNYCIHIMSRSRTLEPDTVAELLDYANNTLGLNIHHLPYKKTVQEGC